MKKFQMIVSDSNKFKYLTFELIGILFSIVFSFILHDLFKWSMGSTPVALISPVNESVWEHVKILVIPYLVWAIIELTMVKTNPKYIVISKAVGMLFLIIAMIGFHYIYRGIVGYHIIVVDVIAAVLWIFLSYVISIKGVEFLENNKDKLNIERLFYISVLIILIIVGLIVLFTFAPPKVGLFRDGQTGQYGIDYSMFS